MNPARAHGRRSSRECTLIKVYGVDGHYREDPPRLGGNLISKDAGPETGGYKVDILGSLSLLYIILGTFN